MSQPGTDFERTVAEFCRRNWPSSIISINSFVDGKESDIIISSRDDLLIIEITIDKSKKKAEGDIGKIREFRKSIAGDAPQKTVRGFFITPTEPSPDVHKIAVENGSWIEACSFPAFINRFNSSTMYLQERAKRSFGSVRNPSDDSTNLSRNQYVQVPLKIFDSTDALSLERIVSDVSSSKRTRCIITGDFGVGKSMTYRELFYRLSEQFMNGLLFRFPIYINLNDVAFDDNDDVVDLLERHAKWVGMRSERDKLVHAWLSDCCILILDGFDELIRAGFTRLTTSSKDIRFASCHIIRAVVSESPPKTPIFLSGRESYFATFVEMRECMSAKDFAHISLHDLDEKEVKELYRKILPKSKSPVLMDWLPQRALLLSYIYFELGEDLSSTDDFSHPLSPGDGWNLLLDKLCVRETKVAKGAEPGQIRRLVERVALYARTNIAELGRVTSLHVAQSYRDVMEMEPDTSVQQVLMRLPGLTAGRANEERTFIDNAFYSASQAGTIVEIVEALGSRSDLHIKSSSVANIMKSLRNTRSGIDQLTAHVVISRLRRNNQLGLLGVAIREAMSRHMHESGNLVADLLVCAMQIPELTLGKKPVDIVVTGAIINEIEITSDFLRVHRLRLKSCVIDTLTISAEPAELENITFINCDIGILECSKQISLSIGMIGIYKSSYKKEVIFDATNADIMSLALPDHVKVMKIIIRKLFMQAGSGRKKAALYRGMFGIDGSIVDRCLSSLLKHKICYVIGNPMSDTSVWHPNRAHGKRAQFIVSTMSIPDDDMINDAG